MMAWNDSGEYVVAGTGEAYVGAVGATAPTTPTSSLSVASWTGLGYHTEDGVSISHSIEVARFRAWQSRSDTRRDRESETFRVTFALQQWNETNVPFAFGGGAITGSGPYTFTPADDDAALAEKSLVVDVKDGAYTLRFVVPRGTVVESVESQFARTQEAVLPITFEALEPTEGGPAWYFLTDAPGFAAGS
jgi:hypothetical protein